MTIAIRLSGCTASVGSEPAEDFLRYVAKTEPEQKRLIIDEVDAKGDPVAVTALILAIPGAILATMDLVERAKVAEKIRKLIEKVRKIDGSATLQIDTKPPIDLKEATKDQVMDLISTSD